MKPANQNFSPNWISTVTGVVWPTGGTSASAHLQSLLFQLEHSQWLPPEALREKQLEQLRTVLGYAKGTVPYYFEALSDVDVGKLDWNRFVELPLLSRRELQENFDALSSRRIPTNHGEVTHGESSGSTGAPTKFLHTGVTQLFWEALNIRDHLWHRRDFSGKLAAIRATVYEYCSSNWGMPAGIVFQTGEGVALNISTDVAAQLEWLCKHDPDYLITHPSNLQALANLSLKLGLQLPRLREARTSGEVVSSELRKRVFEAWGVPVVDVYSSAEVGVIALQCPLHEHLHIQSESLLVEVLHPDGNACHPGETGEIVITSLHNFGMPLIRYRIGDYAEVGSQCPCGRGLPVLTKVHGRKRNMLHLPDGRTYWPIFPSYVWTNIAPIEQFQLIQKTEHRLLARYVMARALELGEQEKLYRSLQEKLRYPLQIDFERVEQISRTCSYKFEDFVSMIGQT